MNIQAVVAAGTRVFGRTGLQAQKYSPEVLVGVGIVGLVTAGVLAARATLKVEDTVEKLNSEIDYSHVLLKDPTVSYKEEDHKKGVALAYRNVTFDFVKLYGPAVSLGAVSIAAILGGQHILRQRNVAVMAAYKVLETSYSEYRKRVRDSIGEDEEGKIYRGQEVVKVTDEAGKTKKVLVQNVNGHSPYARFFDEVNSPMNYKRNRPDLNQFFILSVQRHFDHMLRTRGYVFLNEVYEALGMERSTAGQVVGWLYEKGGDSFISFGIDDPKNEMAQMFLSGDEDAVLLDFNVDGMIHGLI